MTLLHLSLWDPQDSDAIYFHLTHIYFAMFCSYLSALCYRCHMWPWLLNGPLKMCFMSYPRHPFLMILVNRVLDIRCICMISAQWTPQQEEYLESAWISSALPFAPLLCKAAADWLQGAEQIGLRGSQIHYIPAEIVCQWSSKRKEHLLWRGREMKVFQRKPWRDWRFLAGSLLLLTEFQRQPGAEAKWSSSSALEGRSPVICSKLSSFPTLISVA